MMGMKWKISFYSEKVEKRTLAFSAGILANFIHIVDMMEDLGPSLGEPYTKAFGNGLFEIRARGKEGIGRSFFGTLKGREIIILHSFVKKSQKTPQKEIKVATKRLKKVK
ncbi:conserved hypothetical protein [Desulfotalea psychrophila LSv54]|uniref:Phage-related protein n=2 Tax=Desulfotalea psychrophila TaxID=84980 RepID=Q6AID6_DESPS|nr:conserved hypothetical protein [Desulfotalea psychrophila LSv54]